MHTIHVTNWSSRRLHGPGRLLTIMAIPRSWEHGQGCVRPLTPAIQDLLAVKGGTMSMITYRHRYLTTIPRAGDLAFGRLLATTPDGNTVVGDGDTLCCSCSRDAAAAGRCHRAWAAEALVRAGWDVILDGHRLVQGE